MNIKCDLIICILSVFAFTGKHHHHHHHHHHHGNGLGHLGRHRKRSRSRCARRILEAIDGEASSSCEHGNGISGRPFDPRDDELVLVPPPGAKKSSSNVDFLITETTPENRPSGYTPVYSGSKVYEISAKRDANISFVFVSTLKNFYPQIRISKSESKGSAFREAVPFFSAMDSTKGYQIKKDEVIAVEIGHDSKLDSHPFSNSISTGGFNLIVSQNGKTLESYLEKNKIEIWNFHGEVTLTNGLPLSLTRSDLPNLSHGLLNTRLTPYYDSTKNSISLYYHKGSSVSVGSLQRSSTVEQYCKMDADPTISVKGSEPSGARYVWEVPSQKICDFTDFLKEFN